MSIESLIATGIQPVQIPSPLAQASQLAQLRNFTNQNELARYTLGKAQQEDVNRNALNAAYQAAYDPQTGNIDPAKLRAAMVTGGQGAQLPAIEKNRAELEAKQAANRKITLDYFNATLPPIASDPTDEVLKNYSNAAVKMGVMPLEVAQQRLVELLSLSMPERQKKLLNMHSSLKEQYDRLVPPPTTPPSMVGEYNFAKTPDGGRFVGTYQDFVTARAAAGRAPPQPVAPTLRDIQDPTNPAQTITVDARVYKGGGIGSPGVLGASGKTATAAAAEQKKAVGAEQVGTILDSLRTAYDDLDAMRAIPSEQRNVLTNLFASAAASTPGQIVGRAAATPEQTQRDIISSSRNQLLNAVKNATGMSAQQLNSNVEFKSWIASLTDPTKSIQANRAILDNLDKFIASNGKYSAKEKTEASPATPKSPAVGTVQQGYRFKGGDPSVKSNWEKQ